MRYAHIGDDGTVFYSDVDPGPYTVTTDETYELLESRPHWTQYATVALLAVIAVALILG